MCLMANLNRSPKRPPFKPSQFNPYKSDAPKEKPTKAQTKAVLGMLKALWVKDGKRGK